MTIPAKLRRTITVNGEQFEYCVTGYVKVFIKSLSTNREIHWGMDVKPKWQTCIKPSDIKFLIENKRLFGVPERVQR